MKKLHTAGYLLGAALLLTACGGGEPSSSTLEQKSAAAAEALSVQAPTETDTLNAASMHSSNAFTLTADNSRKSESKSATSSDVARNPQRLPSASQTIKLGDAPSEAIAKRNLFNSKSSASNSSSNGMKTKLHQTGFGRPIAATSEAAALRQLMAWTTLSSGNAFGTVRFESTDAAGIRLGLLIKSLPDGAMVRVAAASATSAVQFSGAMINQAIAANVAADGDTASARTYWLPMVEGSSADLEIELPAGTSADQVLISVPSLMHMMESAAQASLKSYSTKTDCPSRTPDAMCSTPLPPAANAVAAMDFTVPGKSGTYACTGTLLADKGATQQPYFLTAQHCISSQTSASSLATYWFYRTTGCDTGVVSSSARKLVGGAALLFTRSDLTPNASNPIGTDTSFLKLNGTPPAGAMFAGWSSQRMAISPSVSLTGLHHPIGNDTYLDTLRQSTGTVTNMARVSGYYNNDPDYPYVETTSFTTRPMYSVTWSKGITESGSSGSGLFLNASSSNPQVVGQLWGGSSSCSAAQSAPDIYGRFDLAYQDGLINWLNPGYKMVFRFFNTSNGAHFFTATVDERDSVRSTLPNLSYEAPVFSVASAPGSGLSPVYRFYNTRNGAHFYTMDESERANVQATAPWYTLEGVAWYARPASNPGNGSIPVYRFFVKSLGTHLYTIDASERDSIIANLSANYTYEGIAYQAWAAN
jgi:lysyl endopeptidase